MDIVVTTPKSEIDKTRKAGESVVLDDSGSLRLPHDNAYGGSFSLDSQREFLYRQIIKKRLLIA